MPKRLLLCLTFCAATSAVQSLCQAPTPLPAGVEAAGSSKTTSLPAYDQQAPQQPSVPAPVPAPAPVVVPASPTDQTPVTAMPPYLPYGMPNGDRIKEHYGSAYIPVDSWIYPAMTRLYSLGYANTMFLAMRPWTRQSVLHILQESEADIRDSGSDEAQEILATVLKELATEDTQGGIRKRGAIYGVESYYTRVMGISGNTLRDSYHLGETIVNDYGRPYQPGFNSLLGFSSLNEYGRFSVYVRGEFQHSPQGQGYSHALSNYLSQYIDAIPYSGFNAHQATIPEDPQAAQNPFRLVESTLSFHFAGHEISGGKSDSWLGPAQGGALAWSNNAENIYAFRVNRVEPLHVPLLSRLIGPMRYDFYLGSLKGHTAPNDPWTHSTMFSFAPTRNFQFAFQRTVIFGGKGHEPITLHTFLKSFFSISDTTGGEKYSRSDPGARFSDFSMSYRLPFIRKYVTFYVDSIAHDDVTPPSAPRRASFRTGLYLAQIPHMRKLDFRFEAMDTDPITSRSSGGTFNYFETIQLQGYTNKGVLMGDWIGREGKGGQTWLTYHLSGDEFLQLEFHHKKNDKDFGPGAPNPNALGGFDPLGGTTQNAFKANVVKRFHHNDIEVNGWFQYEAWKVPAYMTGKQTNATTAFQITYFPGLKTVRDK